MEDKLNQHWTAKSISAFVHLLSFDFITQIYKKLEQEHITKREFARRLSITAGRVSQLFDDPGNIELQSAVKYARGVGMKVALVAYDDSDLENITGPINSEIFFRCWQLQGRPKDFFDLAKASTAQMYLFPPVERDSATNKRFDDRVPYGSPAYMADNANRIAPILRVN